MEKAVIAVVYHSRQGHTKQVARLLGTSLQSPNTTVHVLDVQETSCQMGILHQADAIIFGSPTYFGDVSAGFKAFMEATANFWYQQPWKNKLAAAFTVSNTVGGDKSHTLESLFLFAAQHGMHWINTGILPRFINDQQTEGQNRLACYTGLMIQSDNSQQPVHPLHPGDLLTAELFAARILSVTLHFKQINTINNDTHSN